MLRMESMSGQLEQKDHEILKLNRQVVEKNGLLQEKDALLEKYAKKKKRMDFFVGSHSNSDDPPASRG